VTRDRQRRFNHGTSPPTWWPPKKGEECCPTDKKKGRKDFRQSRAGGFTHEEELGLVLASPQLEDRGGWRGGKEGLLPTRVKGKKEKKGRFFLLVQASRKLLSPDRTHAKKNAGYITPTGRKGEVIHFCDWLCGEERRKMGWPHKGAS